MYFDVEGPSILTSFDIFLPVHVGNTQKYTRFGCTVNVTLDNSNTFDYFAKNIFFLMSIDIDSKPC